MSQIIKPLSQKRCKRANLETMPVIKSVSHYGWINDSHFLPGVAGEFVLDTVEGDIDSKIVEAYKPKGDLDTWLESVGDVVRKYPFARLQMAAGFGAPLLKLLGERPFVYSIYGPSGGGKTAGSYAAISAWGYPPDIKCSWNSTMVGIERRAGLYSDLPLLIDERQMVGDNDKMTEHIIYMLGSGQGRSRGRKNGGLDNTAKWRTITLSTGEQPLSQDSSMKGVKKRILEVYGRPFERDEDIARRIYDSTETQYGTAGPVFIEKLIAFDKKELFRIRDSLNNEFIQRFPKHEASYCVEVALLCLADYLQSIWFYGIDESAAYDDALQLGSGFIEHLETTEEMSDAHRAIVYLQGWINKHREFFKDGSTYRYGYITPFSVQIFPLVFDNALKDGGFNSTRIRRDWAEKGWITSIQEGAKRRTSIRRTFNGERMYVVEITQSALGCYDQEDD